MDAKRSGRYLIWGQTSTNNDRFWQALLNPIDQQNFMPSESRRAPFIVIEGLDRSGKTTQTGNLHTRLQNAGINSTLMKFPGQSSLQSSLRTREITNEQNATK